MAQERNEFTESMKVQGTLRFLDEYTPIGTVYDQLFTEQECPGAYTYESSASGLGDLMLKPEGEPIQTGTSVEGYPVYGKLNTFAQKISWSKETYDDIQVQNAFMKVVASWSESVARTKDRYFASFFNKGALLTGDPIFNASIPQLLNDPSGNFCYDNKPLFTDTLRKRSNWSGQQFFNHVISNDLSAEALQAAYVQMTTVNNRDEKGDEVELQPDILLVPKQLEFKAEELLQYVRQFPNTADFLLNNVKVNAALANRLRVVSWSRLDNPNAWFLLSAKRGLVQLTRGAEEIDFWVDPDTKSYCASILVRWGGYCRNWRYQFGNNCRTA